MAAPFSIKVANSYSQSQVYSCASFIEFSLSYSSSQRKKVYKDHLLCKLPIFYIKNIWMMNSEHTLAAIVILGSNPHLFGSPYMKISFNIWSWFLNAFLFLLCLPSSCLPLLSSFTAPQHVFYGYLLPPSSSFSFPYSYPSLPRVQLLPYLLLTFDFCLTLGLFPFYSFPSALFHSWKTSRTIYLLQHFPKTGLQHLNRYHVFILYIKITPEMLKCCRMKVILDTRR